ncbi:helix-turn-helix domain-containing protein [Thermotalea metallivorans]|uniref:HTH-type transcriptional regulator Xre n=1 Tax=Thermotalea metallivorans TaxID=520762 RepID=A0A140LCH3_9FIRM|nr:helix-turn-helix transcriptional regulator [Thermotalea metallivorans]KXG78248.1 HTH-type transcriptional regulator Xre [Thermotalea metallivorans]
MIGERIRLLRNEKEITQRELAEYLGLTPKMISFYENGERFPPHDIIIKLSDYFNVSTDYLLGKTDIRNPYEIKTIAAHHDGEDWTEEELADIEKFKEFVRMRREQKKG